MDRMERKAAGLPVDRIGPIPGRRRHEPIEISRARADLMAELRGLPAVPDVPFEEMTDAEQLAYLSRRSRGKMLEILNLPTDLDALGGDVMMQHRRYRMQAEVAQSLQTVQVRVDDASLRHQERSDLLEVMREQLKNIRLPSKD